MPTRCLESCESTIRGLLALQLFKSGYEEEVGAEKERRAVGNDSGDGARPKYSLGNEIEVGGQG